MSNDQPQGDAGLAQDALQQFLLYDAVDRSPALVFIADGEMRYLAVNNTACDVLGYTRAEILALKVTDVVIEPEAPSLYRAMLEEGSQRGHVEIRAKDGSRFPFAYEAAEVRASSMSYWISVGFVNPQLLEKVQQLERALYSRVAIEQAKGVLSGRYGVGLDAAFDALRRTARSRRMKLQDLARRVVDEPQTPAGIERHLAADGNRIEWSESR